MKIRVSSWGLATAVLAISMAALAAAQQKPDLKGPAAQAYGRYREAVARAKTVDELLPFVSKTRRGHLENYPTLDWFNPKAKVHVVDHDSNKQESSEDGSWQHVSFWLAGTEEVGGKTSKAQGSVDLLLEDGDWKVDNEVVVPK
jgi:hypothetical protein